MRTHLLILFCLLAPGGATAGHEPVYDGRSLSDWINELDPHLMYEVHHPPPEVVAIRQMGTNALPLLLKWMAAKDPPVIPKPNLAPCYNMTRSEQAAMALGILEEKATPAIPELTRLALSLSNPERYDRCINALADIGPNALPSFNTILTRGSPGRQCSAMDYMPVFHSDAVVLLPAAIQCLVGRSRRGRFSIFQIRLAGTRTIAQSESVSVFPTRRKRSGRYGNMENRPRFPPCALISFWSRTSETDSLLA